MAEGGRHLIEKGRQSEEGGDSQRRDRRLVYSVSQLVMRERQLVEGVRQLLEGGRQLV